MLRATSDTCLILAMPRSLWVWTVLDSLEKLRARLELLTPATPRLQMSEDLGRDATAAHNTPTPGEFPVEGERVLKPVVSIRFAAHLTRRLLAVESIPSQFYGA